MTEEKQIAEMAREICPLSKDYDTCKKCDDENSVPEAPCIYMVRARQYASKGYRKASDVAREIFEEIEGKIASLEYRANTPRKTVSVDELKAQMDWLLHEVIPQTIAELKKKYSEEKI